MRNIIILSAALMLTACGSNEKAEPVQFVDNRTCSQKMYDLGETIQSMHYLGLSRRNAMDQLVSMYGPGMTQLSDFTAVVWSMPKGHWAKGEVGGQLRDEAIRQGCI
jgi:hypothetical protein